MFSGVRLHPVQLHPQLLVEDLVHQRTFPAAGDPRHAGKRPQRNGHVNILQVVLRRAVHNEVMAVSLPPHRRHGDRPLAREVLPRQRVRILHDFLRRTGCHHPSSVAARPGADVDEVVRRAHGVLVVLHHNEGIAQIPQPPQGGQQLVVVPLVQADGRLIQNIQHPHKAAADLSSQPDALALAAGERSACTCQRQISQPHGLQKPQS